MSLSLAITPSRNITQGANESRSLTDGAERGYNVEEYKLAGITFHYNIILYVLFHKWKSVTETILYVVKCVQQYLKHA